MDKAIAEAYAKIYNRSPDSEAEEWQAALEIINHWDVPLLGENLAKECLFRIINHTPFPDEVLTKSIVGVAEEKILELFPELGWQDHVHIDVVANLERKYWEQKKEHETKTEIKESRVNRF